MPKSKKRGGAKAHRKRVQARNNKKQAEKNKIQRIQREMLEQIMLEAQQGQFENTENLPDVEGAVDMDNTNESDIGDIELEL